MNVSICYFGGILVSNCEQNFVELRKLSIQSQFKPQDASPYACTLLSHMFVLVVLGFFGALGKEKFPATIGLDSPFTFLYFQYYTLKQNAKGKNHLSFLLEK
jgi:hypothetical protein